MNGKGRITWTKTEFPMKVIKLFLFIYLCLSIECFSKWWFFLKFDEIKVFVRVPYILIRNILIWVEYSLKWYYNLVSLSECSLITYLSVWFKWVFLIKHNCSFICFSIYLNIRIWTRKSWNHFQTLESYFKHKKNCCFS